MLHAGCIAQRMRILIVNHDEVAALLPMTECIDVMANAFAALARGDAVLPLRPMVPIPGSKNLFAVMPAYLGSIGAVGCKALTLFPLNDPAQFDSHQGAVLLFETTNGQLLAVMDAVAITAIRTAAVSALATRLLARTDAGDLAILGAGMQAMPHLEAMRCARPIHRVRVWSRTPARAAAFRERASRHLGVQVETCATAREAVVDADIICTVTASREPVLAGDWVAPGAHINAVGTSLATARELDTTAVRRARCFVDRRESAMHEAGELLIPRSEGAIGDDHIVAELGELVAGAAPGRLLPNDITLFKSLGLAIEDLAAAHHVRVKALAAGAGTWAEL
jgi:alanine dehydrogenase